MTNSIFQQAVDSVLRREAGYVNDPQDPGGETNFGITKRSYPSLNIKFLTREQAVEIYRRDFWERIRGDELPAPLAFFLLDMAANLGVSQTVRYLQRAAGVPLDGVLGPKTLAAAQDPAVLPSLAQLREAHYKGLRTFGRYGRGWLTRNREVLAAAQSLKPETRSA